MDLSRRKVLGGLIAGPAILRLGIYMPVKSITDKLPNVEFLSVEDPRFGVLYKFNPRTYDWEIIRG